jgi:indolepyruvate ferredoxin oxidoreductase beta subunit
MTEFNIVLAGVGGQGTILAAEILGTGAVRQGLNVRVSEIHGMAQRGGTVSSTVRIGETVKASTILEGQADVLLSFEMLETLRSLKYTSEKTLVIMSSEKIPPAEFAAKGLKYPSIEEVKHKIKHFTQKIIVVDTARLAKEAGSSLAQNSVLLGTLASVTGFPIQADNLVEALKQLVPAKQVEMNVKAFHLGFKTAEKRKIG